MNVTSDYDIFLSYNWDNKYEVNQLYRRLKEDLNFNVWFDQEKNYKGKLYENLSIAIARSKVFLCCVTREYSNSEVCRKELLYAVTCRKPIIPAMIDNVPINELGEIGFNINPLIRYNLYKITNIGEKYFSTYFETMIRAIKEHLEHFPDEPFIDQNKQNDATNRNSELSDISTDNKKSIKEKQSIKEKSIKDKNYKEKNAEKSGLERLVSDPPKYSILAYSKKDRFYFHRQIKIKNSGVEWLDGISDGRFEGDQVLSCTKISIENETFIIYLEKTCIYMRQLLKSSKLGEITNFTQLDYIYEVCTPIYVENYSFLLLNMIRFPFTYCIFKVDLDGSLFMIETSKLDKAYPSVCSYRTVQDTFVFFHSNVDNSFVIKKVKPVGTLGSMVDSGVWSNFYPILLNVSISSFTSSNNTQSNTNNSGISFVNIRYENNNASNMINYAANSQNHASSKNVNHENGGVLKLLAKSVIDRPSIKMNYIERKHSPSRDKSSTLTNVNSPDGATFNNFIFGQNQSNGYLYINKILDNGKIDPQNQILEQLKELYATFSILNYENSIYLFGQSSLTKNWFIRRFNENGKLSAEISNGSWVVYYNCIILLSSTD